MSSTSTDLVAERLAGIQTVDFSTIGLFITQSGTNGIVQVGATRLTVPFIGSEWPLPGEDVRLLTIGPQTYLWGSVLVKSALGKVTALGSPRLTIEYPPGSGVTKLMINATGLTNIAVNDDILIDWREGGIVTNRLTAAPIAAPVEEQPPGNLTERVETFTAADSGSWDAGQGWSVNSVYASSSKKSAWFYGTKIRDTIPDNAEIISVRVYLTVQRDSGAEPRLGTHTHASQPGGNPGVVNLTAIPRPLPGWKNLPVTFGDLLKTGAALGVGADGAGFTVFNGTQRDGQSGALEIKWRS